MPLISIDLKSAGVDPAKIQDIEARADAFIKNIEWLSKVAVAIVTQLAAKFHFDLPPTSP